MSASKPNAQEWTSTGLKVGDLTKGGDIFAQTPWDAFTAETLGQAALVPTMLNVKEQSFYVWLGRDWASGAGAIVDLGSFAGGSAACLAEGVAQAKRAQVVVGYDKFGLQDYPGFKDRCANYWSVPPASQSKFDPPEMPESVPNDLLPLAELFLSPWGDGIQLHKGQIEEVTWDAGPIEVLVMDASKTAATMDRMSATFFPHLIPGRSIVVQQDFLWWQQPWIAAQMALLTEYFTPVAYVPRYSVSYLCTKTPPSKMLQDLQVAQMRDGQIIAAIREAKTQLQAFDIERPLRRLIKAVRANPGERKAYKMQKPAK
ncbi:MAG: hypothetical protein AAF641_16090 [Pseudomonadota bacterium]